MMNLQAAYRRLVPADPAQRRFGCALAVSIAIHALLLWPASLIRPTTQVARSPAFSAVLRERPHLAAGESTVRPTPPPPTATKRLSKARSRPKSERLVPSKILARNSIQEFRLRAAEASPSDGRTAAKPTPEHEDSTAARSVGVGKAELKAASTAPSPDDEGIDAEALRQYRFAVSRAVRKDYPPLAIERGWTGTTQLRLLIGAEAAVHGVSLLRSSGHALLDAKAQDIIGRAARSAAVPETLRGRDFAVDLSVEFKLDDALARP
jgi:periplasmic protein TonB